MRRPTLALLGTFLTTAVAVAVAQQPAQPSDAQQQGFKFRAGVELINVTATVTDESGRFVPNLTRDDFRVYDDDQIQPIAHFSAERVPVSLGILLDTSGSMEGPKMSAARQALERFLVQLLDPDDEVFLYRFDSEPELVQGWTRDRQRLSDAIAGIQPRGGTALYDALAEAIPLAETGKNRKKAIVVISDGNDTSSHANAETVKRLIRQSEVLVYAVGIDGDAAPRYVMNSPQRPPILGPRGPRRPFPFPIPGGRRPVPMPPPAPGPYGPNRSHLRDERVNAGALRDITDDSGGRTEIIRDPSDLDPATAGIADELSKQYDIGYAAPGPKDGRWHTIRVELRNPDYRVRARRGYLAGP
ncbi:MAG TPA: VWA domain-containing protein [Vicinamibacterales bacterium]|nr:VWA domain-containing protein [Vicinamibacterales bacterium]